MKPRCELMTDCNAVSTKLQLITDNSQRRIRTQGFVVTAKLDAPSQFQYSDLAYGSYSTSTHASRLSG